MPERPGLRQVGAGWCLLAFPILPSGAIATRPRRRLTRQRWPSRRSAAGSGGGVRELSRSAHRWIQLIEPACTSCMICARECPTWCITIDSHTEPVEGLPAGAGTVLGMCLIASPLTGPCVCIAASALRSARTTRSSGSAI